MSEKKPRPLIVPKPESVSCLRCARMFKSPDKSRVRMCERCRGKR